MFIEIVKRSDLTKFEKFNAIYLLNRLNKIKPYLQSCHHDYIYDYIIHLIKKNEFDMLSWCANSVEIMLDDKVIFYQIDKEYRKINNFISYIKFAARDIENQYTDILPFKRIYISVYILDSYIFNNLKKKYIEYSNKKYIKKNTTCLTYDDMNRVNERGESFFNSDNVPIKTKELYKAKFIGDVKNIIKVLEEIDWRTKIYNLENYICNNKDIMDGKDYETLMYYSLLLHSMFPHDKENLKYLNILLYLTNKRDFGYIVCGVKDLV